MISSIDKKRDKLISKSSSFKDALTKNIDDIKNGSASISNAALIGGGILLGGYVLYKLLSSTDYEEEVIEVPQDKLVVIKTPKQESFLGRSIKQSIATFLLAIAKQKLMEYLDDQQEEVIEK